MKLQEILNGISYICGQENIDDIEISDIVYNSKSACAGTMFVCLSGARFDGHKFAPDAYEKGCRVFLCEMDLELPDDAILIFCKNTRASLAVCSCNFFRNPSKELKVIGVTGTKGKTTTTHIIKKILDNGGVKTGIIGTIGAQFGDTTLPTVNTTPESYELQKILRIMADNGCKAAAIEVSSLGLKHHRVDGVHFHTGIFTNFYEDHIGTNEHESLEEYFYWKKQLFPMCDNAIVNIDDSYGKEVYNECKCNKYSYGVNEKADFVLTNVKNSNENNILATDFSISHADKTDDYSISLMGSVNAFNGVVAVVVAKMFGISDDSIKESLKQVSVKGRGEIIPTGKDFSVIIDYAHNGASLKNIIETAKQYKHNRIIALFGSVGGRTEVRRKELGSVSGELCDITIITSDDPDFEDPKKIIDEIASYVDEKGGKHIDIVDREQAISTALSIAQKDDIIILAGKGHEEFMKINGEKKPFSERVIVKHLLNN